MNNFMYMHLSRKLEIEKVGSEVKGLNDNQIQVMTNQGIILKAVEKKTP